MNRKIAKIGLVSVVTKQKKPRIPSELSKWGKYAVIGAALIIFFAASPLLGAADDDWPFDHDPMAVDSLDDMLNPSDDNIIHPPGGPVTIKAGASIPNDDYAIIDVYGPDGLIDSKDLGSLPA